MLLIPKKTCKDDKPRQIIQKQQQPGLLSKMRIKSQSMTL